MKGAYFEVLSDLITSIGVIAAALIIWTTGWYYADPLISAGIGLFIFPRTWLLMRDVVGVLLEGTPKDVNAETVRRAIADVKGVSEVHDLHIWSLTSGVNAMSAHAVIADHALHDQVLQEVRERISSSFKIAHVTLQVECEGCGADEIHL